MFKSSINYNPIPSVAGYLVGTDGSVWGERTRTRIHSGKWRQLRPTPMSSGHLVVNILGKLRYVHHLVLEAFVGPCPPGMECRHFPDRDPANNKLENLSWGTHADNLRDRKIHQTDNAGSRHGMSKLTERQVLQIRKDHETLTLVEQAQKYKVTRGCVYGIVTRRTWKHV